MNPPLIIVETSGGTIDDVHCTENAMWAVRDHDNGPGTDAPEPCSRIPVKAMASAEQERLLVELLTSQLGSTVELAEHGYDDMALLLDYGRRCAPDKYVIRCGEEGAAASRTAAKELVRARSLMTGPDAETWQKAALFHGYALYDGTWRQSYWFVSNGVTVMLSAPRCVANFGRRLSTCDRIALFFSEAFT